MTESERDRYSRQILFEGIGANGQDQLLQSTAVVVGCGALGSLQAAALVRAGVGRVRLIDRDYVELSNLQRQWLYDEEDAAAGLPKAIAARKKLKSANSLVEIEAEVADLTAENAADLLGESNVLLDATDNFETRYLINDFSCQQSIPWIYGAAVGSYGLVMPVLPGRTACLECIYPEPPGRDQPTCETAGVLNTITALVASWQTSIAFRILIGEADHIPAKITSFEAWQGTIRQIGMPQPDPQCPACGLKTCRHLQGADRVPISLCGRNAVQIHDRRRAVDLAVLAERLNPLGEVRNNGFALRFLFPPYEMTVFSDGRAIIKGTVDPGLARSLYSRYVGN